jgi:hypothetical protein
VETLTCKGKVEELSAPATAPATVSAGRECLSPSRFSDGSIKEVQALGGLDMEVVHVAREK